MPFEANVVEKQLNDTLGLSMIDRLNSKDAGDKEAVPSLLGSLAQDQRHDVLSVMQTWADKQHKVAPSLPELDIKGVGEQAAKTAGKQLTAEQVLAEDVVNRLRLKHNQTPADASNAANNVNTLMEMLPWQNRLHVAQDAVKYSKEAHEADHKVPELKASVVKGAAGEEHLYSFSKLANSGIASGFFSASDYSRTNDVYKNPAAEAVNRLDTNHDHFLTEKEASQPLFTKAELSTHANPRQERFMVQTAQSIVPLFFGHDNIEKLYNDGRFTSGWPFRGYISLGDLEEYNDIGLHGNMKNKGVFR